MNPDCALCRRQPACAGDASCGDAPLLVHAASPILADRIAALLAAHDIACAQDGQLFRFTPALERPRLAATLRANLVTAERRDVRVGRGTVDGMLRAEDLDTFCRRLETSWFEQALAEDRFTFHYQPIVELARGTVFAHECLVRLEADRLYLGGEILDAMLLRGEVHRFDAYCRGKAIRSAARQHRGGQKVFINFQPSSIYDPAHCLRSTLAALSETHLTPEDIVFEVVETEEVRQVAHLKRIADYYRGHRFGFALDDVGAGANTLAMVRELRPDYLKLDKSLTRGLPGPASVEALRPVLDAAAELGCRVVAEGVESAAMAEAVLALGVTLMQGWHFGRPAPHMTNRTSFGRPVPDAGSATLPSAPATQAVETGTDSPPAPTWRPGAELATLAVNIARHAVGADERLRLLESVVVHCNEMVLVTELDPLDEPGPRILYVNPAFSRVTGYAPEEVIGRSPRLLQGPRTSRAELDRIRATLARRQPVRAELLNYGKDGQEYWIEMDIVPVRDEDGRPTHAIAIQRDISERRRVEHQLAHQAMHDPLTGLANRRRLFDHLGQAMSGTNRPGAALTVCVCDIDGFKRVNDTYGHAAGDEVLIAVGRLLREGLLPGGIAGRLGGDEFCLVWPVGAEAMAAQVEQVRARLEQEVFRSGDRAFSVTASFGLAGHEGGANAQELLQAADQALYRAKQQGRNCVVVEGAAVSRG